MAECFRSCNSNQFPAGGCDCGMEKREMLSKSESSEMERENIARRIQATQAAKKYNDPHFTIEEIAEVLGKDADEFLACMEVVEAMIADPHNYTGARAGVEAVRLSALRTKLGMKAQLYKSAAVGNADLRKRKDVLMCMYDALLENINCLKGMAKYEREIN